MGRRPDPASGQHSGPWLPPRPCGDPLADWELKQQTGVTSPPCMPQPEATPGFLPPRPDLLVALGGQQAGKPLLFGWTLGGEVPRGIVLKMEPLHDQQLALEPFTHPPFQTLSSVGPLMDPDVVPFRESEEPETSHAHVCSCCCLCFRRFSVRHRAEPLASGHTPHLVLQSAETQPALPSACKKVDPDTSP